jgi:hypothetical protein
VPGFTTFIISLLLDERSPAVLPRDRLPVVDRGEYDIITVHNDDDKGCCNVDDGPTSSSNGLSFVNNDGDQAMTARMALWITASLFAPPLDICFRFRTFHLKTMYYVQNLNKKARLFFV